MFKRFGQAAMQVVEAARQDCQRFKNKTVGTEHLLLALTAVDQSLAARALAAMGINSAKVAAEVERLLPRMEAQDPSALAQPAVIEPASYSDCAIEAFVRSVDQCRYFGLQEVNPEHLLLAVIEVPDCGAMKILEELGANLSFLRRHIMFLMSRHYSSKHVVPSVRTALVGALTDLVECNLASVRSLSNLAARSQSQFKFLPDRREIVFSVFLGYMPDLLCTQVSFQRHLLQESIKLMETRTGPLDKELTATIVSNSAQHLRLEVRNTIEYLWGNEYRLFDQMLNEAEHDLIGSVIEDIWWAQSEEIALHELFDEALVDHRRKQLLSLQKRRLEISQRLTKLRTRLEDTIRQCFSKYSVSA